MRSPVLVVLGTLCGVTCVTGCPPESRELSVGEAQLALEKSALASQAETLVSASVDVSTQFTIGGAIEQAAIEAQAFVVSQLPCAQIRRGAATLSIEYGALPGAC